LLNYNISSSEKTIVPNELLFPRGVETNGCCSPDCEEVDAVEMGTPEAPLDEVGDGGAGRGEGAFKMTGQAFLSTVIHS